jgi:hypothetical protein
MLRKENVSKLIPSLALSIFASVGLILLLIVSGLFEGSVPIVLDFLFRGFFFVIVTFLGVLLSVYASLKRIDQLHDSESLVDFLLNVPCFAIILTIGVLCMHWILASTNWWWLITIIALSGLTAVFQGWHIYFQKTRRKIKTEKSELKDFKEKNAELFVKSLELEHSFFQSYFQQFASISALFFTAAVVGYYLSFGDIKPISLINASIMVAWFIVGLFYGLFVPIQKHLEHIRQEVRDIALNKFDEPFVSAKGATERQPKRESAS